MPQPQDIRSRYPLQLTVGSEDLTPLLSEDFTFSNSDPGGYEMASFPVPHDLPQVVRGMPVRLTCGTSTAWEGRVKEIQRSLGAKTLIQCEGYGALLKDQNVSMIFADRDLSKWGDASLTRHKSLVEQNYAFGTTQVTPDLTNDLPAVMQEIVGAWGSPNKPVCEGWYNAGPTNLVSYVYYNPNFQGGNFVTQIYLSKDDAASVIDASGNLGGGAVAAYFGPRAQPYRYAVIQVSDPVTPDAAIAQGEARLTMWRRLTAYGNHGLTKRGPDPAGFYASDIAQWLVAGATPPIEGLQPGVIEDPSLYIVPHLAYYTAVEGQQVLADLAKLTGSHWGVWESLTSLTGSEEPRLDFRPRPQQGEATASAWRHECEVLDIREDLTSQYNMAHVAFTEVSGNVGMAEATVANPILEAVGIDDRMLNLSLGTSTKEAAEAYGEAALLTFQHQGRVLGNATIKHTIHDMRGGEMPPWMLKAGIDRLRIPDLPSTDVWGVNNELPISRVECSAGTAGITTRVEFGLGPNLLEVMTAQLQEATFGDVV